MKPATDKGCSGFLFFIAFPISRQKPPIPVSFVSLFVAVFITVFLIFGECKRTVMKMPTYYPVHNYRNSKNKNGRYKIHIRIYLDQKPRYYEVKVPLKVREEEWAGKDKAWVKNTHPFAFEINEKIKERLEVLDKLVKRYYNANKSLTFPLIFKELKKRNNTDSFLAYFDDYIKDPRETVDEETLKRYRSCWNHLSQFNATITFNDLSGDLFQDFKKYLEKEAKLVGSTINGYFNAIKKVVFWARKDNHITKEHEETIFEDVHIKIGKAKKDHLEVEEVKQWKNLIIPHKYRELVKHRDMFLLLIYTGYYYSDLKILLKTELRKDPEYGPYLYSERFKNDNLSIVPLWKFPYAMELINKYRNDDPNDPYLLRRDCFIEDQAFNRALKTIAHHKEMLGWTRNVYNKLGRKTNAQLYIRFGAKKPIVSKMLGHDKEETTDAYFEVNIIEVIEGTKDVNFEKLGIADIPLN
jgi:site-specific recombinase XerD